MFTPGTKRPHLSSRKAQAANDSPKTPFAENSRSLYGDPVPGRPATGTPAPWVPRLSVLARIPPGHKTERGNEDDQVKPVFVAEFPQLVHDEQVNLLQRRSPGDASIFGGVDEQTFLAWLICGSRLFVWNYLSSTSSKKCIVLEIPSTVRESGDGNRTVHTNSSWLVCVVNWDKASSRRDKVSQHNISVGIVMCNKKTQAIVYWPNVYSKENVGPVTNLASSDELEAASVTDDGKASINWRKQHARVRTNAGAFFNSLIVSVVPSAQNACVALACGPSGDLWQFYCSPMGIHRKRAYEICQGCESRGYPRSLIWRFPSSLAEDSERQFFLLTDHEIQCFSIKLAPELSVSKLWSCEIIGTDSDLGIKKDLAGQKQIWPLDVQVDDSGKVITILVASFCKDRVSSSSYTQYSLLKMQYKSGVNSSSNSKGPTNERVLEKKAPLQVIIPKARVEDEEFLFSMKLRVGGRPSGSAIILSGDGTATVSYYYGNSTRLYQFDLPYDAGKVLDASVIPSSNDFEDGAWVVLTEKAGIWTIPEQAVILGGVEPPERSLSRKGSSNDRSAQEEGKNIAFADMAPGRGGSAVSDFRDKTRGVTTGHVRRNAKDEESEALLSQLFHDFLLSGQVNNSFEKLKNSGAFERDGETNVFTRFSKSIVDTLAKHWTTTRGAEIVAMAVLSTQLKEKQQKHEKFLEYLALSKCHEELCSRQRYSLQIIMEHGEKLAGMIQLRELQNTISQARSTSVGSPYSGSESELSGALWDLIQLDGEKARRSTVLLMDRDNAEVFYSKVSELEQLFYCLEKQLDYVISLEMPPVIQIQRACEISNACVTIIHTALQYKQKHQMWYPPPEELSPWYCQPVVRNGLWSVACIMLQQLNEYSGLDESAKLNLYAHIEALAEVLLEAYTGAITAKVERQEEPRSLLEEYWYRRDTLLDSLYQQLRYYLEAGNQDLGRRTEEQKEEVYKELSQRLVSIAKHHESYGTLWKICCDLNDSVLLKNLMHESVGPRAGFSYFVFKQLYGKREFSKLLRLGEEFHEELSLFLKDHKDILWLHEVFLHQFSSASESLHALALSEDMTSDSVDDGHVTDLEDAEMTLADRKRLLNLSKIAAIAAGRNAYAETKVKRIEADTKIMKLQEEIMRFLPVDMTKQYRGGKLLRLDDLIDLCLKGESRELSLLAFDVFAWTSSAFRKCHKSILEECWRNAADQDDWEKLYQAYLTDGWSDEENLQHLRNTVLFQASRRCYGPKAETFGGRFDEVLPLREENVGSSVESILRQHKDFPYAGKLMLTAIMLGSLQNDTIPEEGPTPME